MGIINYKRKLLFSSMHELSLLRLFLVLKKWKYITSESKGDLNSLQH